MAPPFEEAEEETTAVVQEEARGRGGTATTVLKSWQNKLRKQNFKRVLLDRIYFNVSKI